MDPIFIVHDIHIIENSFIWLYMLLIAFYFGIAPKTDWIARRDRKLYTLLLRPSAMTDGLVFLVCIWSRSGYCLSKMYFLKARILYMDIFIILDMSNIYCVFNVLKEAVSDLRLASTCYVHHTFYVYFIFLVSAWIVNVLRMAMARVHARGTSWFACRDYLLAPD